MTKTILLIAAALVSIPANAQANGTGSVEVSYADLDLTSAAGQTVLIKRLKDASGKVCGNDFRGSQLERSQARQCRNTLNRVAQSRAQVVIAMRNSDASLAAR